MRYRTTRKAARDIFDIYVRGAAEFGTIQAERYHEDLVAVFDLLADNPRIARERTELVPPVRVHPFQAHVIIYVVDDAGVLIVRVLHGRQEWERLLNS